LAASFSEFQAFRSGFREGQWKRRGREEEEKRPRVKNEGIKLICYMN